MEVTPDDMDRIIPYLWALIYWLRETALNDAGRLIGGRRKKEFSKEVGAALQEFLRLLDYNSVEVTVTELRYVFTTYEPAVWADAIVVVLKLSKQGLLPDNLAKDLIGAVPKITSTPYPKETLIGATLGEILDRLDPHVFESLAELCLLLRDSFALPEEVAPNLAPILFRSGSQSDARLLMEYMIRFAKAIFGESLAEEAANPFETRKYKSGTDVMAIDMNATNERGGHARFAPSAEDISTKEREKAHRMEVLEEFLTWREPGLLDLLDQIFENHEFIPIAYMVYKRYGHVPRYFHIELTKIRRDGFPVTWFHQSIPIADPVKSATYLPPRFDPIVPAKRTKVDFIIDELMDTEMTYQETLKPVAHEFAPMLHDIADGNKGREAQDRLLLDSGMIEEIFGFRLRDILQFSETLLHRLFPINAIRVNTVKKEGRAGFLADVFVEMVGSFGQYNAYVVAQLDTLTLLRDRTALAIEDSKNLRKKGKRAVSQNRSRRKSQYHPTFVELWDQYVLDKPQLKGQTIEAIVIQPVRRIQLYEMLFKALLQQYPDPQHPAHVKVQQGFEAVHDMAKGLDKNAHSHLKLKKLMGDDLMGPRGAKKNGEGGSFNQYG